MTRIYLIRHGESIGNATRTYLGHTDLGLSDLGLQQAEETARELASVPFSAIYSSDLMRAFDTATPHAKMRGLQVEKCRELREMYTGEWERAKVDYLLTLDAFVKGWREDFGNFTFPGGERVADAANRMFNKLRDIATSHDGETVAVASHAAAIRAFWCKILGLPKDEWAKAVPFPTNASYSVLEYDNGTFIPVKFSCDEHLSNVTKQP